MTDAELAALAIEALTVGTREEILELRAKFFDGPMAGDGSAFSGATSFEQMDALMAAINRVSDARSQMMDAEILIENLARRGGTAADFVTILNDASARAASALEDGNSSHEDKGEEALGGKALARLVPGFLRRRSKPVLTVALDSVAAAAGNGPSFQLSAKDGDRTRWLMVAGHNGRDREQEIFPLTALELNVKAIRQTGIYPEAWVDHTPGTRWGLADFVDVLDGVYVASGLVDDNPLAESVAVALGEKADTLGVSHAYAIVEQVGSEIRSFFDYELSVLPRERAALLETGALIIGVKEAEMDIKKRSEIEAMLGEKVAAGLFQGVDAVNELVTAAGLDRKEVKPTDEEIAVTAATEALAVAEKARADAAAAHATPTGQTPPAPPETPPAPPTEPKAGTATEAATAATPPVVTTGEKSADDLLDERIVKIVQAVIAPVAEAMGEMGIGMKALLETDDAKLAARIRNAGPAHVASKDNGNAPTQAQHDAAGTGPGREPVNESEQSMADWMTDGIFGNAKQASPDPVTN